MADLVVITPSRGRPRQLREMVEAVHSTAAGAVDVVAGLDDDDPHLDEYRDTAPCRYVVGARQTLSGWTNMLARSAVSHWTPAPRYMASLGDDHRPRTPDWDLKLIEAIEQFGHPGGFAYGNDLLAGQSLPTAWVVSAGIVRALGWMMLPTCGHMFVDAAVLALGQAMGRIVYLPEVVIEHLHPDAGKAHRDESYIESNGPEQCAADWNAFNVWHTQQLPADAALAAAAPAWSARCAGPRG